MHEYDETEGHIWSDLPDRVLHILTVKGNEEAHDGEEHDGIGSHHQATGSTLNLKVDLVLRHRIHKHKLMVNR